MQSTLICSRNLLLVCITLPTVFLIACTPARLDKQSQPQGQNQQALQLPDTLKPGDHEGSIFVAGKTRTFWLHLPPSYDTKTTLPLVVVLHGGGDNGKSAESMTGMSAKADSAGFIAVYPNGTGRISDEKLLTWNSDNCCGYAMDSDADDVGFIRTLIEGFQNKLLIDAARIYITGISNGGMMSYRLACEISDKIAAIAPVAGAMSMSGCNPVYPVSVVIFHGTADEHVLYNGGAPLKKADNHERIDKPVSYAVDFWVKVDGCSPVPQKEAKGNIVKETYSGGRNATEVVLYTIIGGKHAWPGGIWGRLGADEPTQEISATDLMWDFFAKHPKAGASAPPP